MPHLSPTVAWWLVPQTSGTPGDWPIESGEFCDGIQALTFLIHVI